MALIGLPAGPMPLEEKEGARMRSRMLSLSWRNLGLMVLGALLYGVLAWVTNIFPISGGGIDIRPAVAVPLFFGFAFGPLVGFVTGMAGNLLGDTLSGYVMFPPEQVSGIAALDFVRSLILTWQVGNGLMGLVTGLAALQYHRYLTGRDQLRALGWTIVAVIVGVGFPSFMDMLVYNGISFDYALHSYFLSGIRTNLFTAILLVPLLLFNYARLDFRSTDWLHSGLLQRIVLAILLSAFLPVALLGLFLTQLRMGTGTSSTEIAVKLALTALLTLILAVANASLVALSISRPLLRLTGAAHEMEEGHFTHEQAVELRDLKGNDELSQLSAIFGKMAEQVIARESSLRQQVQQLKIEIDQAKKQREVAEVTDSQYFRDLQQRARELRARHQNTDPIPTKAAESTAPAAKTT